MICIEKGAPLSGDTKKSRNSIPIDDIREMIRISSAYPFEGGNRVILFFNAENMTIQAQNSLLKILEEPPLNTYFILTSDHPELLLVTIRSRCLFLKMRPWEEQTIFHILTDNGINEEKAQLAACACNGSIGYAKELADDENYWKIRNDIFTSFFGTQERSSIMSVSSHWKENKSDADLLFNILEENIRIMLNYRITKRQDSRLQHFSTKWKSFAASADIERFIFLMSRVSESRKQYGFNVNIQAIVEQLLLNFIGEVQ